GPERSVERVTLDRVARGSSAHPRLLALVSREPDAREVDARGIDHLSRQFDDSAVLLDSPRDFDLRRPAFRLHDECPLRAAPVRGNHDPVPQNWGSSVRVNLLRSEYATTLLRATRENSRSWKRFGRGCVGSPFAVSSGFRREA